jgi:hypothetical protein
MHVEDLARMRREALRELKEFLEKNLPRNDGEAGSVIPARSPRSPNSDLSAAVLVAANE